MQSPELAWLVSVRNLARGFFFPSSRSSPAVLLAAAMQAHLFPGGSIPHALQLHARQLQPVQGASRSAFSALGAGQHRANRDGSAAGSFDFIIAISAARAAGKESRRRWRASLAGKRFAGFASAAHLLPLQLFMSMYHVAIACRIFWDRCSGPRAARRRQHQPTASKFFLSQGVLGWAHLLHVSICRAHHLHDYGCIFGSACIRRLFNTPPQAFSPIGLCSFVVKTANEQGQKVFINVCGSAKMPLPPGWSRGGAVPPEVRRQRAASASCPSGQAAGPLRRLLHRRASAWGR